jgi:hypothetical protein
MLKAFPTKGGRDEWFISSSLFGLHLLPLTTGEGELNHPDE